MTDKTKSQTYNFLSENKSIEDIKKQPNTTFKEKSRHGGKTFKIIEKITASEQQINDDLSENINENLKIVTSTLTNEVKEQEIQQLKNKIEELKQKQIKVNFDNFKYNVITIYDEKQSKKTGIYKIHEEILPIEDKIIFITTFVNIDNSITEEVIYFQELINSDIQVVQQIKNYKNISEYKKDILLMEDTSKYNNCQFLPIKDFLKKQQDFKLKTTKKEIGIWIISWLIIPLGVVAINLIHPPLLIMSLVIGGIAIVLRGGTEVFSPKSKKVWSLISNKICKNDEKKDKEKKERQSIIKNLTNDKLETKLQTQYEILKQELDNRKDKTINELLNNSSNIEPVNVNNFDSSIRNTVNQQEAHPKTSTIYHSNSML